MFFLREALPSDTLTYPPSCKVLLMALSGESARRSPGLARTSKLSLVHRERKRETLESTERECLSNYSLCRPAQCVNCGTRLPHSILLV